MLQPAVFAQLARINIRRTVTTQLFNFQVAGRKNKNQLSTAFPNPTAVYNRRIKKLLEMLQPDEKHWLAGGQRAGSVAVAILKKNEVIAIPTDTVYGFAALAQSSEAIEKLYAIKGRDKTKPLAISLTSVADISNWAEVDHVSFRLLVQLLPGPVTVVLKRNKRLNPDLNPGYNTVGIRVPLNKFIRYVTQAAGQPLALTSANVSNEPSSLHPNEFKALWPKLGAVFYGMTKTVKDESVQRRGSTVVDLTVPGEFEILRRGIRFSKDLQILKNFAVQRYSNSSKYVWTELRQTAKL